MNEPIFCGDSPPRDTRRVRIAPRRPMLLQRAGETAPRHADAGKPVTVERWVTAGIAPADFEVVEVHPPSIEDHSAP